MKKNETGFGLLQVILLLGVVTASGAFLVQRSGIIGKSIRGALYRQELFVNTDRLKDILTDSGVCSTIFKSRQLGQLFSELSYQGYGTILKVGSDIGSNNSFSVTEITLRDIPAGFIEFVYRAELKAEFRSTVFIPQEIEQRIPLVAHVAGNTVQSCYYDPHDPDPWDNNAEGLISEAIKRTCRTSGAPGATLNPLTMDCHIPGIATLPNLNTPGQENMVYKGVQFVTNGEGKTELSFIPMTNQYWLPGKSCPGGFIVGIKSDGSLDCRSITFADMNGLLDTTPTTCHGSGAEFALKGSKIGVDCIP